jgi:anti-sigma-K factor RskA
MPNTERLQQRYEAVQARWQMCHDALVSLEEDAIRETRIEEKNRLDGLIKKKKSELERIEEELEELEVRPSLRSNLSNQTTTQKVNTSMRPPLTTLKIIAIGSAASIFILAAVIAVWMYLNPTSNITIIVEQGIAAVKSIIVDGDIFINGN